MLRVLLVLLLLANGLFHGWVQGWLAPLLAPPRHGAHEREPGRLQAQVRPESITLLSPVAASAAVREATRKACLEAGPFVGNALAEAEAALARAGVDTEAVRRVMVTQPAAWVVFAGPFAEQEPQRRKEDDLRRLRIEFEALGDDRAPQPGLALGRFGEREAAETALATLIQRGLRGARVLELPARPQPWLRLSLAPPALQARLSGADAPTDPAFKPCAAER